jgi:hypothetical protein
MARTQTLYRTGPRVVLRGFNVFPTAPVGELSRLPHTEEIAKAHPDLPEMLAAHVMKRHCVFQPLLPSNSLNDAGRSPGSFRSYRWQQHCRGLFQTPIAA